MPKKKHALSEKEINDMHEYLDSRYKSHNSLQKKMGNVRKDIINQLAPWILNEINKDKIVLRQNQLGVGVSDTGIEIRIHVNKSSQIDYTLSKIDWDGNIRVFPDKDYVGIMDRLLPFLEKIIPKY